MQPAFTTPAVPQKPRSLAQLLGDTLKRPGGRRGLSVLSLVLFVAGIAMFAYPVGTDIYSRYQQGNLNGQFGDKALQNAYRGGDDVAVGRVLTRLIIPKKGIDLNVLVVEGTTPAALRAGAGHYVGTPLPGEAGNVGIAGHRTTFGRPFNHLDELGPGDKVLLETPTKIYTYIAVNFFDNHTNPWVVKPTDYSVVAKPTDPGARLLTLTSCNPKGSAKQRIVLRLELHPELTRDMPQTKGT